MEYYEFKPEDAERFASFTHSETRRIGHELIFNICPYCHGSNRSDRNKFSINLDTGLYRCFRASCDAHGNFFQLARDFGFEIRTDVKEYYHPEKKYRTYRLQHIESKDAAVRYCASRGISEDVCKKYEITVQKDADNILVFPFRDTKSEVCFIKYRKTDFDKERDNCKEWCEKGGKPILFGMYQCDKAIDTLVLTEGQLDSLSVATAGVANAVSVPTGANGTTWIPYCWDFVREFKTLIVFGDCEKGHITLVDMVAHRFPGVDVKVVQEADYRGCKDANEILTTYGEEAVRTAVANAQSIPISRVRSMAEVERVNILQMDGFSSGITELDDKIVRIFFGQVILLTGRRGDGKSTFLNQLMCNAVDSGVKSMIYSGELPNYVIRNFTDTMLSGKHESEITSDDARRMADWYRDKLYVYDSSIVECDEHEDLLKIVEQTITQYGVRFIGIDNLMTVVEATNNDTLYRQQSQFVGKLAKMAKKYNVVIVLVAHPRKQAADADFSSDDVSGSSDITNRVDVVVSYQRCKKKRDEPYDDSARELWVTKVRLTGKIAIGEDAIPVKYDPKSRRITGKEQSFNRVYGWERTDRKPYDGFDGVGSECPF